MTVRRTFAITTMREGLDILDVEVEVTGGWMMLCCGDIAGGDVGLVRMEWSIP